MGLFGGEVHRVVCDKCGWKGPKRDNADDVREDARKHSC